MLEIIRRILDLLAFCGQERCLIDGNGRIRLTPRFVEDFIRRCDGEVVMHALPERAIAIYPEEFYHEMRAREIGDVEVIGNSFAARRSLRRFGAMTVSEKISRQGRVTLPAAFRDYTGLGPGVEACIVGVEIGVEIWSAERFAAECAAIDEEMARREEIQRRELENSNGM